MSAARYGSLPDSCAEGPCGTICAACGASTETATRSAPRSCRCFVEKAGDFQGAHFTAADTVIRIERTRIDAPGRYTTHVRELALDRIGCADLVDAERFTEDFSGEEE